MQISIIIPTFNGAQRLPKVLDHLSRQVIDEPINWEVIVVDNNSYDETAEVVSDYAKKWREDSHLRYIFETKQGAAYARICGVKEAKTKELIGFLDDDNLPAENWVSEAIKFGRDRPQVGAYGGIIHARLEGPVPSYFNAVKSYLTVYNRGLQAFQYRRNDKPRRVPAAPGVVIRRQAWEEVMPPTEKLLISGRNANTMAAGEDAEMMFYLQNSRWEVWHNPKMEIWHYIPDYRLEREYLLKLARGYGLSNYLTRLARYQAWQRPFIKLAIPFFTIRDAIKLQKHYWLYRKQLAHDIDKACRFQVIIGQLISPYLSLHNHLFQNESI